MYGLADGVATSSFLWLNLGFKIVAFMIGYSLFTGLADPCSSLPFLVSKAKLICFYSLKVGESKVKCLTWVEEVIESAKLNPGLASL